MTVFETLKKWWDDDTGGWPTFIVCGLVALFLFVVLQ